MENPNSRPYTTEELEALLGEEVPSSDIPKNNKGGEAVPDNVILENNNLPINELAVNEKMVNMSREITSDQLEAPSKLKKYAPLIILGVVLTGVGIYLHYDYRKRKAAKNAQKP